MAKPSQPLAQRALLLPYSRDLAFRLSLGNLSVHGIDCLARLGRSVAVLAMASADGRRYGQPYWHQAGRVPPRQGTWLLRPGSGAWPSYRG